MDFGCSPKGCQRDQSSCVVRHGFEMFWCQVLSTVAKFLQNGHYKLLFVTLWSQRSNWHQQWSKCKKHLQISQSRVAKLLVSLVSQHSQRVQVSLAAETVARSQFRRVQDLHATDIFPSGPDCWRQLASSRVIQTSILKNEQLLVPEASHLFSKFRKSLCHFIKTVTGMKTTRTKTQFKTPIRKNNNGHQT